MARAPASTSDRLSALIAEIEHAQPWGCMEHPRLPAVLSGEPAPLRGMPAVGEHNDDVLTGLLGLNTAAKGAS